MVTNSISRQMNARVVIESDATVADSTGGRRAWTTPATVAEVWAQISYSRVGRETFGSPEYPVSQQPVTITIWQRRDVTEDMRVKYSHDGTTRYFQIRTIKAGAWVEKTMTLECEEIH